MLTLFLAALDGTIVNTALPTIARDLHGFDRYTWPSIAYLLTSTTMIPIVGKLSDQFGRKWFLMSGVVIFLLGSALCGATPEIASALNVDPMNLFIFFRGFQGIGGGMLFSLVFTSIGDIFPPAERAQLAGTLLRRLRPGQRLRPDGGWLHHRHLGLAVDLLHQPAAGHHRADPTLPLPPRRHLDAKRGGPGLGRRPAHRLLGRGDGRWSHGLPGIWLELGRQARAIGLRLELAAGHWHPGGGGDSVPCIPRHRALLRGGADPAAGSLQESHLQGRRAVVADGRHGALRARPLLPLYIQGVLGYSATNSGVVITPLTLALAIGAAAIGQVIARVGATSGSRSSAHVC